MEGHLILNPSNHRIYSSSAIGDLRMGSSPFASGTTDLPEPDVPEVDGRPETSSCTSVTTSPFAVISLLRVIRL
jgi:hypothetical protein